MPPAQRKLCPNPQPLQILISLPLYPGTGKTWNTSHLASNLSPGELPLECSRLDHTPPHHDWLCIPLVVPPTPGLVSSFIMPLS